MEPAKPWIGRWNEAAFYRADRFNAVVLAENERVKTILVCLEPGQFIPVHSPGVDVAFAVLDGEGTIIAGDREVHATPGHLAFVPARHARGVKATTRMALLHVVTPPPTDADHVEVMRKLKAGIWP